MKKAKAKRAPLHTTVTLPNGDIVPLSDVWEYRPPRKRVRRKRVKRSRTRHWRGTDLVVIYKGGLDGEKDHAIRKALGKYETGSGFSFTERERDHTATVPENDFARVIGALKKIPGISIKKQVIKWVRCR